MDLLTHLAIAGEWCILLLIALFVVEVVTSLTNQLLLPTSIVTSPCSSAEQIEITTTLFPSNKVAPVTPVVNPLPVEPTDYFKLTKAELHKLCRERGLPRKSAYSKAELVALLL